MSFQTIDVRPLTGALGAEIHGANLTQPLSNAMLADIHQAWREHLVIFFRDQALSPKQHHDFAKRFGKLMPHPYVQGLEGFPEIIEIVKEPSEIRNWGGGDWHSDLTFLEAPPIGAVLYSREVPPTGGDTLFANLHLAYETLSPGMQEMLGSLRAVHESGEPEGYTKPYLSMRIKQGERGACIHPVVRTHPDTGRKALFVNSGFTTRFEDMTVEESRPLLDYLFAHCSSPEFTCRFRWAPGSVAVWDNRVTHHRAVSDDFASKSGNGYRRVMHRATLAGERPH